MKPSRTLRLYLLRLRRGFWRHISHRVSPPFGPDGRTPSHQTLLLLVPVIGAVVGLTSLGIAYLIHGFQGILWGDSHNLLQGAIEASTAKRVLLPAAGGLVLGLTGWILHVRMQGHGTAGLMHALALKNGVLSLRQEYPGTASGILTVACGGSLGREGPMVEAGTALSSWVGRRFHLEPRELRILVCAAAGAGMAAAYNAPIGGAMFAVEVLIGNLALEVLGPVVLASVVATLISRNAMGTLPRFVIPEYHLVSAWEILGYLGLGILGGLLAVIVIRTMALSADGFGRLNIPKGLKPFLGFGLVGVIGIWLPQVYGNGYEAVNLVLHEDVALKLLLILPAAKLLATALTRGSGGTGGMFTPTLMMGALLGGSFGTLVHGWFPAHTAGPGAYALVGMAAVLAGTTHAPIMAIFMIFEQTDSYQIILPLMLVSIVSYAISHRLQPRSLHETSLRRRGIELPRGREAGVMQSLRVSHVMHSDAESVRRTDSFSRVVECFLRFRFNYLYVVDEERHFLGVIAFHGMKNILDQSDALDMVIAQDLLDPDFETVTPDDTLAETMERFWKQNSERLPVVASDGSGRLVGWISKRDLIAVYKQEILGEGRVLSRFGRAGDPEGRRDRYVELPESFDVAELVVPGPFQGRTLRDLDIRGAYGVHVLQIVRYDRDLGTRSVQMPGPDWVLGNEDRLVVVGPTDGIARFRRGDEAPASSLDSTDSRSD
jgi:CIC family chloride channel protein